MDTGSAVWRTPNGVITHGSYFLHAKEEGLLIANTSIHAGIRGKLSVRFFLLKFRARRLRCDDRDLMPSFMTRALDSSYYLLYVPALSSDVNVN